MRRSFVSAWRLSCALCAIAIAPLWAQETAPAKQDAVKSIDAEQLKPLDELFAKDIKQGRIVGCQALVCLRNDVCYFKTFGQLDREKEKAMEPDAIFRIYSMSKPITSVAVMILVEEEKIDLDAPVSDYLPEFAELKVLVKDGDAEGGFREAPPEQPMTVRDLLRHTSGLTYGFFGDTEVDQRYRQAGVLGRDRNLQDMVAKLAKIPLLYQPGERFHYSVSTDVLGRVVEVVSQQSFKEFLEQRIFNPLGMKDTFFTVPKDKQLRLAQMYAPNENGLKPANPLSSWRFVNPSEFYSGGGGLCSTCHDYLRFCKMMLNEGELDGVRILKPETVRAMTKNQLPNSKGFQFGLGVSIDGDGAYGWGGAAGTRFWIDPKNQVIGIFMVQVNPYRGPNYEQQMKRVVSQALREQ